MTLIDSNVIVDLMIGGAWAKWTGAAIETAAGEGRLVINHVVLAELHAGRGGGDPVHAVLSELDIDVAPLTDAVAVRAGRAHRLYRERGGECRAMLADFLIGAHAATLGMPLLTRDRRRFASYFPELVLIAPESATP